jgi:hypothetical protein
MQGDTPKHNVFEMVLRTPALPKAIVAQTPGPRRELGRKPPAPMDFSITENKNCCANFCEACWSRRREVPWDSSPARTSLAASRSPSYPRNLCSCSRNCSSTWLPNSDLARRVALAVEVAVARAVAGTVAVQAALLRAVSNKWQKPSPYQVASSQQPAAMCMASVAAGVVEMRRSLWSMSAWNPSFNPLS